MNPELGLSGRIARIFLTSEITPLLAVVGVLLGLFAVMVTPREEEPQIDVTFANVFVAFPGASVKEVELTVTTPTEKILSEIKGVNHIYSASAPGMSILTVEFEVGEKRNDALVRLYNAIYSNQDWLPRNMGVGQPLIKPKGIDDVPIVAGTLWSDDPQVGADELARVAHTIEAELKRVPGTRDIYTIGAPRRVVKVRLDPQRLASHGISLQDLRNALLAANNSVDTGGFVDNGTETLVQAGTFLTTPEQVSDLVVGVNKGAPVYLRDVADVAMGPDQPEHYVQFSERLGPRGGFVRHPAVTIAVAKKPGSNAVDVASQVITRFEQLKGTFVPDGIQATVTRNYGFTANDKAQTLINKLIFATTGVVLLVLFTLGWRQAVVVGAAVVVTLLITLFASWAYGFTLNRVSLFALIFSIGILVDDAIVVVENMHRHMRIGGKNLTEAIPIAVDEVGGPTILATFAVIAALLPMAFVTGLMGPYMAPIPINASMGMLISLVVAFVFSPWLYRRVFIRAKNGRDLEKGDNTSRWLHGFFTRLFTPFLRREAGRIPRVSLLLVIMLLIFGSVGLVGIKAVVLKMLPFDNKSEFQVVVDMPEGTPVEQTAKVLNDLGDYLGTVPEAVNFQIYAGTSAPISFNGLVRQYYLRAAPHMGDIQVNLVDKKHRDRQSHEIALSVREPLQEIAAGTGANVKIVEVPPGPPVMSPLVAEVYGLNYRRQSAVAKKVREVFDATPDIADVDDSIEAPQPKIIVAVDRTRAARLGVSQRSVAAAVGTALRGEDASYLHSENTIVPIPIRLEFSPGDKADINQLKALRVRAQSGALVPIGEVVTMRRSTLEQTVYHKDLLAVVYVTADMSGPVDSPLYGMIDMFAALSDTPMEGGVPLQQLLTRPPDDPYAWTLKWGGEWQITFETFRDMGIAYSVGLVLIYLLVVSQFRSYLVPLIIMAPIPLTIIGVLPGHALLGKQFTATSMIGMIALAGIIVRNSILLVDFIQQERQAGRSLEQAVIDAAAIRARPIVLTALAAMLGAFFILTDPIFSGLAISLIFGIFVSTILTLLVIPVVYYAYNYRNVNPEPEQGSSAAV